MTETFQIVPASGRPATIIIAIAAVAMLVAIAVAVLLWSSTRAARAATFEVSDQGLRLNGELLWRSWIPASELRGRAARVVDLRQEPQLAPRRRVAGTGLPGYGAGWFRLKNGEKALIYVTARERVVYVPTTGSFVVLLSVTEPERMVESLRRAAPRD